LSAVKVTLDSIKKPISHEMSEFEGRFRDAMRSRVSLLDKIMHYIVRRKGKQLRPMFVFLSAGAHGAISDSTYRGASLIELLHTATLVHDDVVDDSNMRRGFFSVNALSAFKRTAVSYSKQGFSVAGDRVRSGKGDE
jgi:octaprenyl-diphosphate synthase